MISFFLYRLLVLFLVTIQKQKVAKKTRLNPYEKELVVIF